MRQIHTTENKKELKKHGNYSFPVAVNLESITTYEGGGFLWHWHPEIELTLVKSGIMKYFINDSSYILKEGEGLFGNSNTLHSGSMVDENNCEYISITFHPRFIYGYEGSLIQSKYTDFITGNPQWSSLSLTPEIEWQKEVLSSIEKIYTLYQKSDNDYEFEIHLILCHIWQKLYHYYKELPAEDLQGTEHTDRLRLILTFIHDHYAEQLSLDDIAQNVNICKSECCRFFKKHMNMTLFEYLMYYRIRKSLPLLKKGISITKISGMVGFSNPCYYGKIFKRYMNCSPTQYKNMEM